MNLQLNELHKSFETKEVLKGASFNFEQGKIYGLLGRNGSGKTTLFNCLAGEVKADSGNITMTYNGERPTYTDVCLKYEELGYVFSTAVLPEFLTGYEFIRFYMDINKSSIPQGTTIDDYFRLLKMDPEDSHRLIKGYSSGMKNKLQMMLFMISMPPVILLDEPLTSLDVVVALEIKHILREIRKDHIIIFSTHILQLATDLCDEIVILNDGHLSLMDHELLKDPDFEEKLVGLLSDVQPEGV